MFLPIPLHGGGIRRRAQSRGRRQPSGQRPRCPSARLPVPRVAGAIAAAHTIWREGGAPRTGRTEFPPCNREAEFSPRIAGGDASQGEVSPTRRWRGVSGGGRIARQAATIRAAALLTVSRPAGRFSRVAGAIAAAHTIWREGGAPRTGRTEFPPCNREAEFSPRIAGGDASQGEVSPTRRWRGVSGGGRIARQAATIRAAAPLSVSRPAGPAHRGRNRRRACHIAGRGERPAQAGWSSLRAIARRRKRAGGAQTPEIGACKSARRVVE